MGTKSRMVGTGVQRGQICPRPTQPWPETASGLPLDSAAIVARSTDASSVFSAMIEEISQVSILILFAADDASEPVILPLDQFLNRQPRFVLVLGE